MKPWSRRKFVSAGALGVLAGVGVLGYVRRHGAVRLVPLAGVKYSESFLQFASRARFDSVRDALASVRNRRLPVGVAHEETLAGKPAGVATVPDRNLDLRDGRLANGGARVPSASA